jgi:hypothetical protein
MRYILSLLIGVLLLLAGFSETATQAANRQPASIFDYWATDQSTNGVTNVFGVWRSPSGEYSITLLKSKQDEDAFILVGRSGLNGNGSVLGYGMFGADVKWFATKAGEIAVIDNQIDNGKNEILVVMPQRTKKGVAWSLLYRTPEGLSADHLTVAHCNWSLVKLDPSFGSIRLKASWDYSDATNAQRQKMKTEGVYDIPIFYGYK